MTIVAVNWRRSRQRAERIRDYGDNKLDGRRLAGPIACYRDARYGSLDSRLSCLVYFSHPVS